MPATTPNLSLPYPVPGDTVDAPRDIQTLANKLDAVAGAPLLSALPTTPVDGQEVYYLADPTNGIVWHLRYRAGSPSTYKWEFVGGSPLLARDPVDAAWSLFVASESTYEVMRDALFGNAARPLELTVPLAGDYTVTLNVTASIDQTMGVSAIASYAVGAVAPSDRWAVWAGALAGQWNTGLMRHQHAINAGDVLAVKGRRQASNYIPFWQSVRSISAQPVHVR